MEERELSKHLLQITVELANLWRWFRFTGEASRLKREMTRTLGIEYQANWSLRAGEQGRLFPYDGIKFVKGDALKLQAAVQELLDLLGVADG